MRLDTVMSEMIQQIFQLLFWVNHAITLMVYIVIIVRNVILHTMKLKNRTIYIFGCIRNDVEQDC